MYHRVIILIETKSRDTLPSAVVRQSKHSVSEKLNMNLLLVSIPIQE